MPDALPGKGFFGWLGRQIGHVRRAVRSDVGSKSIYHKRKTDEATHPDHPDVKFRRTTIDEVIIEQDRNGNAGGG
jgi:hypothetical protein